MDCDVYTPAGVTLKVLDRQKKKKKPLLTSDILDLCDQRNALKIEYEKAAPKQLPSTQLWTATSGRGWRKLRKTSKEVSHPTLTICPSWPAQTGWRKPPKESESAKNGRNCVMNFQERNKQTELDVQNHKANQPSNQTHAGSNPEPTPPPRSC